MGLDANLCVLPEGVYMLSSILPYATICSHSKTAGYRGESFWYWRKHHELNRWMEYLFVKKGGKEDVWGNAFNNVGLQLDLNDLKAWAAAIIDGSIGYYDGDLNPETGEYDIGEKVFEDMKAIALAAYWIRLGRDVYYEPSK